MPCNFTIKDLRFQYIAANECHDTYNFKIIDNIKIVINLN